MGKLARVGRMYACARCQLRPASTALLGVAITEFQYVHILRTVLRKEKKRKVHRERPRLRRSACWVWRTGYYCGNLADIVGGEMGVCMVRQGAKVKGVYSRELPFFRRRFDPGSCCLLCAFFVCRV